MISGLFPETEYSGFVKALDETGKETFGDFIFTTRAVGGIEVHQGNYGLRYQFQVDNLANSNITTITGELIINGVEVTDLSPLTDLVSLGGLKITYSGLQNLNGLENVTFNGENKVLNIYGNELLDNVQAIGAGNSEFDFVRLEDNDALQSVAGIRVSENGTLKLSKLPITSLSGLQLGPNIDYMQLDRLTSLNDISSLLSLTSADRFEIRSATNLVSINGLQNLTACRELSFIGLTNLQSITELSNLTSCSSLTLSLRNIPSLDGLGGITSLDKLHLGSMDNLNSLDGLSNLTEVGMTPNTYPGENVFYISGLNVTDLSGLSNLTRVRNIVLSYNENLTSLNGTAITNSWNINSDKRLQVIWNPVLSDYCGITEFIQNAGINASAVYGNAYNPTLEQIMNPAECSQ